MNIHTTIRILNTSVEAAPVHPTHEGNNSQVISVEEQEGKDFVTNSTTMQKFQFPSNPGRKQKKKRKESEQKTANHNGGGEE
jgi:hypothetical protein